jgi:hypothetical protein
MSTGNTTRLRPPSWREFRLEALEPSAVLPEVLAADPSVAVSGFSVSFMARLRDPVFASSTTQESHVKQEMQKNIHTT